MEKYSTATRCLKLRSAQQILFNRVNLCPNILFLLSALCLPRGMNLLFYSTGAPLREIRKGLLTQSPPRLNSPAYGVNSTGQAATQRMKNKRKSRGVLVLYFNRFPSQRHLHLCERLFTRSSPGACSSPACRNGRSNGYSMARQGTPQASPPSQGPSKGLFL